MMNTNKTPMRKLAKYLSILPLALLLIVANSMHIQANEVEASSQEIAPPPPPPPPPQKQEQDQPSYKRNLIAMTEFIKTEMNYPQIAKENGIQGRVLASFIIEKDGSVTNPKIVKGVDPSLDKEAIRIINAMPKWEPFIQDGKPSKTEYTIPFNFDLDGKEKSNEISTIGFKVVSAEGENEVLVRGYDSMNKVSRETLLKELGNGDPLYIINDVKMEKGFRLNSIIPTKIESITVLKDKSALEQYGEKGKDGAIIVTLKDRAKIQTTTDKEEIFVIVEDQPQFPGGTEALMQYLGDNINYPKEAHEKKIEGRVIVNFVINEDGSISEVSIVRGVDPLLDAEAIRVVSAMPSWKPGMQRGQAVRVRYTLPITFSLQDGKDTKKETIDAPDDIFVVVEQQPEFPGGMEAMMKFLGDNIKYPVVAQKNRIQGRVIVNFVVNKDGSLSDLNIVRGQDPSLDAEAIRVIATMPKWKPGMQRGKAVNVRYTLPITFRLEGDNEKAPFSMKDDGPIIGYQISKENSGKFLNYMSGIIKYPVIAQENGIMGFVKATYDVNSNGEVSNIKIVEGADPALDKELTRIITNMPKDIALIKSGGKAASNVGLSANFILQGDERKLLEAEERESDIVVVGYGKPAERLGNEAMNKRKAKSPIGVAEKKDDASEKAFYEFVGKNAKYPVIAQENGIMGFVKASYDVNSNGEVSNIKIVEGADPALDKELKRIIEIMPKDIALIKSRGKAASNVEISAVFRLQNGDTPPPPPVKSDVVVVGYGKPAKQ